MITHEPRTPNGAGVAVVIVPPLPGVRAYGATRWLHSTKALIQMSLRGKTDDHLWFTSTKLAMS